MSFLNPSLLFFLFAVSIPILIHLINFRRYKRVEFSNLRLLKEVVRETKKQKKIINILLLISRIMIILLLVLIFAGPFLTKGGSKDEIRGKNSVVVFIDNSFSMQNSTKQGRVIDEAKKKAIEIIEEYAEEDAFMLLTTDLESRHQDFVDKKRFVELLREIEISPATSPNSLSIKKSFDLLSTKNTNKHLYLISDFQVSSFDHQNFPLDSNISTRLIPIPINNINNIYIDSISFSSPIYSIAEDIDLDIRIRNSSDEDVEKLGVNLYINNRQLSLASVDIPKNDSKTLAMSFPLKEKGVHHGRISIMDNPIVFDDDFYFTIDRKDVLRVLSINSISENEHIKKLFSNAGEISLDNMDEGSIDYSAFSSYSLIILNSLKELSSGLASELSSFRDNGGDIIIIPNNDMNLESFSASMRSLSIPYYTKLNQIENKVVVIDDKDDLFRDVFSMEVGDMEKPSVTKYFSISEDHGISSQPLFIMQNKESFLTISQKDDSKVYIFSSNLERENTDFVSQALFVPTLWNMALHSQTLPMSYYFVNDNKNIDITNLLESKGIEILELEANDGSFRLMPQIIKSNNRVYLNTNNQIKLAGNYNILDKDERIGGFSVNYDRRESELVFPSASRIKKDIKPLRPYYELIGSEEITKVLGKKDGSSSLFPILFTLLLLTIGLETMILIRSKL